MPIRFSFTASVEKMKRQFNLSIKNELQQSYNIAAGQNAYVLTNQSPELQIYRWGLIPHWAKDAEVGVNLINAQAEGISTKLSFRMPIRQKRCIVFADSYYEWKKEGRAAYPYRVHLPNNELMAMAGVWDVWESPTGKTFKTFSIITVPANTDLQAIGAHRMPALLTTVEAQQKWLSETAALPDVLQLLHPLSDEQLILYPISLDINSEENNYPELHNTLG